MAEEKRVEEHKHIINETQEGRSETHTHKVVERDGGEERPEVTTINKETTIEETED